MTSNSSFLPIGRIHSAPTEDIETVIIGGKTVLNDGKVPQLDETQLAIKIQEIVKKFWEIIPRADYASRTVDMLALMSIPIWKL